MYFIGCHNAEKVTLQKSLKLFFPAYPRETKHGLKIGPNSSNPKDSKEV